MAGVSAASSPIATLATVAPRASLDTRRIVPSRSPEASRALGSRSFGLAQRGRAHTLVAHATGGEDQEKGESRAVLDAFFFGRAFAEVVNEKLGTAVGELLSEVAKKDAERRREMRDFQEEVRKRARDQQQRAVSVGAEPASTASAAPSEEPAPSAGMPDPQSNSTPPTLEDSVGNLKSEVSQAKEELNKLIDNDN